MANDDGQGIAEVFERLNVTHPLYNEGPVPYADAVEQAFIQDEEQEGAIRGRGGFGNRGRRGRRFEARTRVQMQDPPRDGGDDGNPPPGPNDPPGGNVQRGRRSSVIRNSRGFKVDVADDEELHERLRALDVPFQVREGQGINPHATCAAIRTWATAKALSVTGGRKVLDYYSSGRTGGIVSVLNRDANDPIELIQYFPQPVAGDINRRINTQYPSFRSWAECPRYEDVLVVDVYEDARVNSSFNEDLVRELIPNPGQRLFWIGWNFEDPMAVHFDEAAYITEKEKVLFSPDERTPGYQVHDRCRWIWNSSSSIMTQNGHVCWAVTRNWGGYYLITFENMGTQAMIQMPIRSVKGAMEITLTATQLGGIDWYKHLLKVFPEWMIKRLKPAEIQFPVLITVWNDLRIFQAQGMFSQLALSQVERQVATSLTKDKRCQRLMRTFPMEMAQYQNDLVAALMVYQVEARNAQMKFISSHNPVFCEYNAQRANVGKLTGPTQLPKTYIIASGIAVWLAAQLGWRLANINNNIGILIEKIVKVPTIKALTYVVKLVGMLIMKLKGKTAGTLAGPDAFHITVLTPLLEEVIKGMINATGLPGGLLFAIFETCVWMYQVREYDNTTKSILFFGRLVASFMHLSINDMSYVDRVACHALWNGFGAGVYGVPLYLLAYILKKKEYIKYAVLALFLYDPFKVNPFDASTIAQGMMFKDFKKVVYEQPWPNRVRPEIHFPSVTEFDPKESMTYAEHEAHFEEKEQTTEFSMKSHLKAPGWKPEHAVYFNLIPHQIPGYYASKSDSNLVSIVKARLMARSPSSQTHQKLAWETVIAPEAFLPVTYPPIIREEEEEGWLEHMDNSKKKKYQIEVQKIRENGPDKLMRSLKTAKLQVKTDEWLIKSGPLGLKPRAIVNIDPSVQAMIGPEIYAATQRLKALWDPRNPYRHPDYSFTFAFGSSANDEDLTMWLKYTLSDPERWHIIVAGDDMLVLNHKFGFYGEGDASMYDQSQGEGPIRYEYKLLRILGVSESACQLGYEVCCANYVGYSGMKDGALVVEVDKGGKPLRCSGHVDTTIGNGLIMAVATFSAIRWGGTEPQAIMDRYSDLGFEIKFKVLPHWGEVTFLKGMWYLTELCEETGTEYYWGPLPSRILKVGKSLKDPRTLYCDRDFHSAANKFLGDVATGYSFFIEVPILRAFVKNFSTRGGGKTLMELDPSQKYKIQAAAKQKPKITDCTAICIRYDISEEDIRSLEEMYPTKPFSFLQHPLLEKLLIDY